MVIGALSQVQQSNTLEPSDVPAKLRTETGNDLPAGNITDKVEISEDGRSALERERQNIDDARENLSLVDFRGHNGKIRLGLFALGQSTLDDWSSKGLELTEESILAMADAFQDAFRKNVEENGSSMAGSSIALNRHQIVMNSQTVPDWFLEEYESSLSSMDNSSMKKAFESGETFYVSAPQVSRVEALNSYAAISRNM